MYDRLVQIYAIRHVIEVNQVKRLVLCGAPAGVPEILRPAGRAG